MAKFRFEVNVPGIKQILRGPAFQAELMRRARNIAVAAGPGHEVEADPSPNRAHARVTAATLEARLAEAKNRSLTRAIDAGRG